MILSALLAHATHLVARIAVATMPPKRALHAVGRVNTWLPDLDPKTARHLAGALEPSGTCLTRAMVIATRMRGAELVIGRPGPAGFHAWVEVAGRPLRSWDASGPVLARLTNVVG